MRLRDSMRPAFVDDELCAFDERGGGASEASIGKPPRLSAVLSIRGVTAHDQHRFLHAVRAVTTDVPRNLTAARRETHERNIREVEAVDHSGKIVRVVVHVIAVPWLARTTVASDGHGQPRG